MNESVTTERGENVQMIDIKQHTSPRNSQVKYKVTVNNSETRTYQNPQDATKQYLGGKFIAL